MSGKVHTSSQSELATKGDVESIVNRVVTKVVSEAIDNFAVIVGRSFSDTQSQINGIIVELREFKGEMKEFKEEMYEFKENTELALFTLQTDVTDLKHRVVRVETRLDRVEILGETMVSMWRDHGRRINVLEDQGSGF